MVKRWLGRLLAAVAGLPIVMVVLAAFGRLLTALGDRNGGAVLDRLVLVCGIGWVLTLLGVLAVTSAAVYKDRRDG